ncbi:MAG TPA: endonuclease/exonuclease/phosphatase family protein [Pyrinomonadaceae bacterium]|nr:endonuclease/exonuclease/phosphatase family protein [Pyrinomonadaceae bacterium]
MRRLINFAAAIVLAGLLNSSTTSFAQSLTFARIAGWNQEGVKFDNQGTPQPVSKPAQLRAAIGALNPDVIVLSEVNSKASMEEIISTPFSSGATYKLSMDDDQPTPQKIAVLFRDHPDISVTNRRAIPGSDDNQPDRLRKAWAFDVKIRNFDFLLIGVHLKSARGTAERETRNRQTKAIAQFIRNEIATTNERDVLVIGDYNMIPGQDSQNFSNLSPGPANKELLRFISSGLTPPSHIDKCVNGKPTGNLLDGFSISRLQTNEWTGFIRIAQLQNTLPNMGCTNYRQTVSDHLPLLARFRVSLPDDD